MAFQKMVSKKNAKNHWLCYKINLGVYIIRGSFMDFLLQLPVRYKTIVSAYLSRVIILVCKFITIPIFLLYLPRDEYAVLAILGGLEAWFFLLDFGMGSSVQNTLAENQVKGIDEGSFLKTALLVSLFSLSLGGVLVYLFSPSIVAFFLYKIGPSEKMQPIFLFGSFYFILGTLGSIGGKILVARQRGYQMYLVQSVAHLIALACIVGFGFLQKLSLMSGLFFSFGIPSLVSCLLAIKVFSKVDWKGSFRWEMVTRARSFWLFAVLAAIVSLSDSLIMTRTLSIEKMVEYNLLCKIFGIASFGYAAFLQGLMPECCQYLFMGKVKKVQQLIYKHCLIGILGICLFTCLIWGGSFFIEIAFQISLDYVAVGAFGLYLCVRIVADFYAMALQSHSKLSSFFYLVPIQAVLSLSLQYFLSIYFGILGIILGLTLSYVLTVCWALPKKLKQLEKSYG